MSMPGTTTEAERGVGRPAILVWVTEELGRLICHHYPRVVHCAQVVVVDGDGAACGWLVSVGLADLYSWQVDSAPERLRKLAARLAEDGKTGVTEQWRRTATAAAGQLDRAVVAIANSAEAGRVLGSGEVRDGSGE